jgi:acyl dehydratase
MPPAQLEVGHELPALSKTPGRLQLVQYAAGSGDFNPLHYDPDFPQAREIGDNIVHGRLKYAALGQLVSDWVAHRGFIRRISASYRGMDRRGETFTCRGRVTAIRDEKARRTVELELWTEGADGRRTTEGAAEVVFQEPPHEARNR